MSSNPKRNLRKRSPRLLKELKPHLDTIRNKVECSDYILEDPVQFMYAYKTKKDREIAGFFAALMAWGRRDVVIRKTEELLARMAHSPWDYIMNYSPGRLVDFNNFRHRTFNQMDIHGLVSCLHNIYHTFDDFESFWKECLRQARSSNRHLLSVFRENFLGQTVECVPRTYKHLSSPETKSACKRLIMYLRWTCRKGSPVDPGIWDFLPSSQLLIPLDTHVARQSRRLGLLTRKSNDWKAVQELSKTLQLLNPSDPSGYDFALFGIGALNYTVPDRFILNPHA